MKKAMFGSNGVHLLSSNEVAALRMAFAGIFMLPFLLRLKMQVIKKSGWAIAGVALFGNGIPAFLFTAAETRLNSGFTGMLNATTPLFTVLIAVLFLKVKVSYFNYLGIAIAMAGSLVLIAAETGFQISGDIQYAFLILGATLCYAISINISRTHLIFVHPVDIAAVAFVGLLIPCGIYLLTGTELVQKIGSGGEMLQALGYNAVLGMIGTAVAVILFNRLISISSAVFASSVTYLIPIMATFIGFMAGEVIVWKHIAGMALILAGVLLVNRKYPKKVSRDVAAPQQS
jgi:drug/metabolite transporter (DMT)-like permease